MYIVGSGATYVRGLVEHSYSGIWHTLKRVYEQGNGKINHFTNVHYIQI